MYIIIILSVHCKLDRLSRLKVVLAYLDFYLGGVASIEIDVYTLIHSQHNAIIPIQDCRYTLATNFVCVLLEQNQVKIGRDIKFCLKHYFEIQI